MSNNKHNEESKLHEQAADSPEVEDILNDTTSDTETADITEDEADAMMKQVADLTAALEKKRKNTSTSEQTSTTTANAHSKTARNYSKTQPKKF